MIEAYITKIAKGISLTETESYHAMLTLLQAETSSAQITSYLSLLHSKGETLAEPVGVITALQDRMIGLPTTASVLDIVGTGGDGANTVNISTASAILAASCGVPILKHGGRAVTSRVGSADVIEALGIDIEMPYSEISGCFNTLNIAFCFAARFHPALARLRAIRKQIPHPTIFNLVLPFLNPARPQHYLIGVFSPSLLPVFANILAALKIKKSVVVHSDGLDELTCSNLTQVIEVDHGEQRTYVVDPIQLGFKPSDKSALKGGDITHNAKLLTSALAGESGPILDTIVLNAAMAVYLYGKTDNLMAAVKLAREGSSAGKARALLNRWILYSQQVSLTNKDKLCITL